MIRNQKLWSAGYLSTKFSTKLVMVPRYHSGIHRYQNSVTKFSTRVQRYYFKNTKWCTTKWCTTAKLNKITYLYKIIYMVLSYPLYDSIQKKWPFWRPWLNTTKTPPIGAIYTKKTAMSHRWMYTPIGTKYMGLYNYRPSSPPLG